MAERETSGQPVIQCVLWHAPEAPPTPELTALLVQRGVSLETCSNPFAAAARVCRLERASRAASRAGDQDGLVGPEDGLSSTRVSGIVLLLSEPSRLPMRDGVARVLELHAPRTICWVYERLEGPRLRTIPLSELSSQPAAPDAGPIGSGPSSAPSPLTGAPEPSPADHGPGNGSLATIGRAGNFDRDEPVATPTFRAPPRLTLTPADPESPPARPPAAADAGQHPINTGSVLTDEELAMLLSDDDPPAARPRTTSQEPPRSQRQ